MMRKEPYAMNHRPRNTCSANAAAAAAMGGERSGVALLLGFPWRLMCDTDDDEGWR
jgi:hypothetical protein